MIKPAIKTVAQRRIRILALILGILIFVWLPFEDTTLRWLILLAIALCAWGDGTLTNRVSEQHKDRGVDLSD